MHFLLDTSALLVYCADVIVESGPVPDHGIVRERE